MLASSGAPLLTGSRVDSGVVRADFIHLATETLCKCRCRFVCRLGDDHRIGRLRPEPREPWRPRRTRLENATTDSSVFVRLFHNFPPRRPLATRLCDATVPQTLGRSPILYAWDFFRFESQMRFEEIVSQTYQDRRCLNFLDSSTPNLLAYD